MSDHSDYRWKVSAGALSGVTVSSVPSPGRLWARPLAAQVIAQVILSELCPGQLPFLRPSPLVLAHDIDLKRRHFDDAILDSLDRLRSLSVNEQRG